MTERVSNYVTTSATTYSGASNKMIYLPLNEYQTYPKGNPFHVTQSGASMTITMPQMVLTSEGKTNYMGQASHEYRFRYRLTLCRGVKNSSGIFQRTQIVAYLNTTGGWIEGNAPAAATRQTTIGACEKTVTNLEEGYYAVYLESEINYSPSSTSAGQVFVSLQLAQSFRFTCHLSATKTPITLIARNGLISHVNQDLFFEVINTDSDQRIIAKGLKTEKSTDMTDGELYVSGNFIEAFKDLCEVLQSAFADVRFVGNNESHQMAVAQSLISLKNAINESNLIAAT